MVPEEFLVYQPGKYAANPGKPVVANEPEGEKLWRR
jgi:hypothetical protein